MKTGGVVNMEVVNPMKLTRVAEPEPQYRAAVFEAHQQANVGIAIEQSK